MARMMRNISGYIILLLATLIHTLDAAAVSVSANDPSGIPLFSIVTTDTKPGAKTDTVIFGRYPYIYVLDENVHPYVISDEVLLNTAARVVFPINEYVMPKGDALLRELSEEVIPLLNRDSLQLVYMIVRGAASPEGPTRFNRFLGEHRAAALFDFVRSRLTTPVDSRALNTDFVAEDYSMVGLLMRQAGDADYDYVNSLCERYLPTGETALLKQELQQAQGGALWNRLLDTYYPQVRAARLVLFVRKADGSEPPTLTARTIYTKDGTPAITIEPETRPVRERVMGNAGEELLPVPRIENPVYREVAERQPRIEMLSVKTNLLFYGVYMPGYDRWCPIPNIAVEYYPRHGHLTLGASFDMPWWQDYDDHKYFQLRNYQIEGRYYFKGADAPPSPLYSGLYLSAYGNMGLFGICFDADRGWVGEGGGGGLGVGYVVPISKNGHWRLEFAAQAGFFRCKYDPYQYENPVNPSYVDNKYYYKWTQKPELFKKRQYRFNWIGPTRIGITLSYDLLYRHRNR